MSETRLLHLILGSLAAGLLATASAAQPAEDLLLRPTLSPAITVTTPALRDAPTPLQVIAGAITRVGDLRLQGAMLGDDGRNAMDYYAALVMQAETASVISVVAPDILMETEASGPAAETGTADVKGAGEAYQIAAALGDPNALLRLGDLYLNGVVVPADPVKAFEFYNQAAEQGSTTGNVRTGLMMIRGQGTARDPAAGIARLEAATAAGNSEAMIALAWLYDGAEGGAVEPNEATAFRYFMAAAEAGNDVGRLQAGTRLIEGVGTRSNPRKGFALINEAANAGNPEALVELAELNFTGIIGILEPSVPNALVIYERAAELGSATSKVQMATILMSGEGVAQDVPRALELLEEAATTGSSSGLLALGELYVRGAPGAIEPDPARAFGYFKQAADTGSTSAAVRAGEMLVKGEGITPDADAGVAMISSAGQGGRVEAWLKLGELYESGTPALPADPAKAFEAYSRAAQAGSSTGALEVAGRMEKGHGTTRDVDGAIALLNELGETGNRRALINLGDLYAAGATGAIDAEAAIKAWEQAGNLGEPTAYIRLGDLYRDGDLVPADGEKAVLYYGRAAGIPEPTQ